MFVKVLYLKLSILNAQGMRQQWPTVGKADKYRVDEKI
jgi:hypothetical protein